MALNPGNSNDADGPGCSQGMGGFPGGPGMVDQGIRHAVQMCWMFMPPGTATVDSVEAEIQRIVKRVFENLREDAEHFPGPGGPG